MQRKATYETVKLKTKQFDWNLIANCRTSKIYIYYDATARDKTGLFQVRPLKKDKKVQSAQAWGKWDLTILSGL